MAEPAQIVHAILPTVVNVLGGMMKSGNEGLIGQIREGGALASFLISAGDQFKGNPLMDALLGTLAGEQGRELISNLDPASLDVNSVMESVGGLDDMLKDAGDSAAPVKQFIYDMASSVANAAGGGLFGSGEKVSADEQQFLTDLKGKLGL
ncbi:MAG: hypothetical protein SF123_07425 [Chloroflexota bacterium]|nr:hypothetical protein [Chloroflexota bacterium]